MDPGCFPTPRPHDLSLTKWLERALLADILLNTPDFRLTVSNLPRSQAILHGASHGVGINRALDCKEIASFPLGSRRGGTVRVGSRASRKSPGRLPGASGADQKKRATADASTVTSMSTSSRPMTWRGRSFFWTSWRRTSLDSATSSPREATQQAEAADQRRGGSRLGHQLDVEPDGLDTWPGDGA